jgi:DeoR/GlpR family transcriptional regulator of sugar metabolism
MPAERRRLLLEMLRERGSVTTDQVRQTLGVSAMTVRRDLTRLEANGYAHRTHGGAVLPDADGQDDARDSNLEQMATATRRVAEAVVATLKTDETVFLDSSSSSYHVAREILRAALAVTVITNAVPVIALLGSDEGSQTELIGLGGSFRTPTRSFAGAETVRTIEGLFADQVIFSAVGVTADGSLTDAHPLEATVKRTMITHARAVTLIVAAEHFSRSGRAVIAPASSVDAAYLAGPLEVEVRRRLGAAGVRITRV